MINELMGKYTSLKMLMEPSEVFQNIKSSQIVSVTRNLFMKREVLIHICFIKERTMIWNGCNDNHKCHRKPDSKTGTKRKELLPDSIYIPHQTGLIVSST